MIDLSLNTALRPYVWNFLTQKICKVLSHTKGPTFQSWTTSHPHLKNFPTMDKYGINFKTQLHRIELHFYILFHQII